MNSHVVTVFDAIDTPNKFPLSPTNDNKFTFKNLTINSNLTFFKLMVRNYILNIPLVKLSQPLESRRRKNDFNQYYSDYVNYFILDVDNVKSKSAQNKIIKFFKDYKCILGESRSHNGIDNFNMKGVIFCDDIHIDELKYVLLALNDEIGDFCTIDPCPSRKATYNASMDKEAIIINNENGEKYVFDRSLIKKQVNIIKDSYINVDFCNNDTIDNIQPDIIQNRLNRELVNSIKCKVQEDCETIDELCLSVFTTMGYEYIGENNDALIFKHHTEIKSPGGYFWFKNSPFTMHHFNILKTVNIYDLVKKIPQSKKLMENDVKYDTLLTDISDGKTIQVNERYLQLTPDIEYNIENFVTKKEFNNLKIVSPMGTGKSNIIESVIDKCHDNDLSVLIVTNRVSVALDFKEKYNIKMYNKDQYHINDSLICQYDSLWKYDMRYFDVVIMDEFISVLLHSRNTINDSSMNLSKFFSLFNKKLVIADAFLTGYENKFTKGQTLTIDNIYRDDISINLYSNINYFVHVLAEKIKHGKVTVSSTSISFIESLEFMLNKRGVKVQSLTSKTPELSKEIIYKLFRMDDHDKFDVLIYSPTLTVGLSNMNNVDYHFHYDSSQSTDVISSLQMIKRTRKAKEIHCYTKSTTNYLPTSYDIQRDDYIAKVGKNIDNNNLFEFDLYGNPKISSVGKNSILVDVYKNILEFNHKNAFEYLLKYQFKDDINIIDEKFETNILTRYQKILAKNKEEYSKIALAQYMDLNDIEQFEMQYSDDKIMEGLAHIHSQITTNERDIVENILECQINDSKFIDKCYYYNIVNNLKNGSIDKVFIRRLVSKSIKDSDTDKFKSLSLILDYDGHLNERYTIKEMKDNKIKKYLEMIGFRKTNGFLVRYYEVDENVKVYSQYIRI